MIKFQSLTFWYIKWATQWAYQFWHKCSGKNYRIKSSYSSQLLCYPIVIFSSEKYLTSIKHCFGQGKASEQIFKIGSEILGLKNFQYRIGPEFEKMWSDRIKSPIWKVNIGSDRCSDVIGSDLLGFLLCWNIYWKFSWIILRWLKGH